MKFFAVFLLLAFVATAFAAKLPAVEQPELKPDAEVEPQAAAAEPRDKRGLVFSAYAAPYAAAYSYPYAAAYSYPYAYSAFSAPLAYRSAYYPSVYSSYVVG